MVWNLLLATGDFQSELPIFRRKRSAFEIEDLPGLWRIHWQWGEKTVLSTFYTRIDQACIVWGVISALIFVSAQFISVDWQTQAILWSSLTLIGMAAMVRLSGHWRNVDVLGKVIDAWVVLMLMGLAVTDLSIFLSWGSLMGQLCALWLVLNAIGYLYSGLKLRSRAFAVVGWIHLASVVLLPYLSEWQFLLTGVLSGGSPLLLAELQWDSGDVCAHLSAQAENSAAILNDPLNKS
jgi:hypothetical protein